MSQTQVFSKLSEIMAQADDVDILFPVEWVIFSQTKDIPNEKEKEYRVWMFKFQSTQGAIIHEKTMRMGSDREGWYGHVLHEHTEPLVGVGANFFNQEVVETIQGMQSAKYQKLNRAS